MQSSSPGSLTSPTAPGIRMDKWLWCVRLFKTRAAAAEACQSGHVRILDQAVKPSRIVRVGDVIQARTHDAVRTIRVLGILTRRVGAQAAAPFVQDVTPPVPLPTRSEPAFQPVALRPRGSGRPTKKERRLTDALLRQNADR